MIRQQKLGNRRMPRKVFQASTSCNSLLASNGNQSINLPGSIYRAEKILLILVHARSTSKSRKRRCLEVVMSSSCLYHLYVQQSSRDAIQPRQLFDTITIKRNRYLGTYNYMYNQLPVPPCFFHGIRQPKPGISSLKCSYRIGSVKFPC